MRRWTALLLLFIATTTSLLVGDGSKHNFPGPTGYVNDYAAQIAVVTVQSLSGSSIKDYALHLFNEWGIGHKEDNRGLLVLLSMEEHRSRIEVGLGFETLFPNERVAAIVADMALDLKVHRYSQALLSCTKTLASAVAQEKHVQLRSLAQ